MSKRLILNHQLIELTIQRLCQELIENHDDFENSVIIGLQPKGIFLAEHIKKQLKELLGKEVPMGYLDVTFYRDDFRRRDNAIKVNETRIDFVIENKKVILIDDVLFTGRTVRAALDAMIAFGRPEKVELLVLIDRKYSRDVPIEPNYYGKQVDTIHTQKVLVELQAQGMIEDNIWLVDK